MKRADLHSGAGSHRSSIVEGGDNTIKRLAVQTLCMMKTFDWRWNDKPVTMGTGCRLVNKCERHIYDAVL